MYVPESTRALKVLEQFKQSGMHIALITDEYGGIEGLVTLNDLMEAIVGDLPSAEAHDEPMVVQREDGSWLMDGLLSIDEFNAMWQIDFFPAAHSGTYHTLGGFVIHALGYIPHAGDHFEWGGFRFEIMDMDGTRVDKVLTTRLPSRLLDSPRLKG